MVNADGSGDEVQVTWSAGRDIDPAFSPDGKQLVYTSVGSSAYAVPELRTVRVDGSDMTLLRVQGRQPSWSPDGANLLYTGTDSSYRAQVFMTEARIGAPVRS